MRTASSSPAALLICLSFSAASCSKLQNSDFFDWKSFKANGANLGSWLAKEKTHDPIFWSSLEFLGGDVANTADEWSLCEVLGYYCGPVFEARYFDFLNTTTIDNLADVGVNLLRITTTYAAWIRVPGSQLYHGMQQLYLRKIAMYAIEKYGMHVVIGPHSLPGGSNGLDIGEAFGYDGWFFNETSLEYSLRAVDAILKFVRYTGHMESFTISPLNEVCDNLSGFGTPACLSDDAANWTVKYVSAAVERVPRVDKRIPIMLQDSFKGAAYWAEFFDESTNLVIDTHVYYWQVDGVSPLNVGAHTCEQASSLAKTTKFPTVVGEFAIQVHDDNSLDVATRKSIFDTQRYAWKNSVSGGAFWTAVSYADAVVDGRGIPEELLELHRL